tara:strand:- start:124 stop:303 length:180 start_codon:yes stop_codon:yes gene_type:complete
MTRPILNISYNKENITEYNEIKRRSALSYLPEAVYVRGLIRKGLEASKENPIRTFSSVS